MKWSSQQEQALKDFKRWFDGGAEGGIFHIFGFAGTGKTSLALELASGITGDVCFAAFTGKAASVMRSKGCHRAGTIHSLIYTTKSNSKLNLLKLERELADVTEAEEKERLQREITREREALAQPNFKLNAYSEARKAKLIVIDEVSMVDGRVGEDLRSFNVPILVLGDPAQLPPVKGSGFFMTDRPEVMLTEVHRTALDNPVLRLATRVREGEAIDYGQYGASCVAKSSDLGRGASLEYDQVIVGKNATRRRANQSIRAQLGYSGNWPEPGEKLVCLKNNHELGLLNGVLYTVVESQGSDYEVIMRVRPEDSDTILDVEAYPQPFLGQDVPRWSHEGLQEFDFGYAITCHKSQGSEWPSVYIVDESAIFRNDRNRWLYTAITRAGDNGNEPGKVMLVR